MQKEDTQWKPVAYASRSMSETERRYAQIEKEELAVTWACEKFASYILGKRISDHRPLVPLLGTKDLDNLPRVLRLTIQFLVCQEKLYIQQTHCPGHH